MNLAATISLAFGGQGSGCNPEAGKCGRPAGAKKYPESAETGKPYQIVVWHSSKDGKASPSNTGIFFHTEKEQSRLFGDQTQRYSVTLKNPFVPYDDSEFMWLLEHGREPFDAKGAALYEALSSAYEKIDFDPDPKAMIADKGVREAFRNLDAYVRGSLMLKGYDGLVMSPNWLAKTPMAEVRKFSPDGIKKVSEALV